MGKLRDAKILGGIGAILLLLSFIPFVSIIGIVLMFIAVKYISDETKDKDIFKNYLYSFIFNIIAIIAFISKDRTYTKIVADSMVGHWAL